MLQEAGSQLEWIVHTLLQQAQKTLAVKLVDLLQVRKDDVLFAAQWLRQRDATHLRDVIINHVLQRADVACLRIN